MCASQVTSDTSSKTGHMASTATTRITLPAAYSRSWFILAVAWAAYSIDLFMRYNIPTVMPLLRKEDHWSAGTVGWVDSSFLLAYALTQVPWGYASEKWLGARWTVTIGTAMIALASVFFALHESSLSLAIASRAIIGAGAAAVWVPLNPVLARWFSPALRGMQTGIMATGGTLGTGAGGALMPLLLTGSATLFGLSAIGSGFLYSAIPGIIMLVIIPFVIRNYPEELGLCSLDTAHDQNSVLVHADEPTFGHIMRTSKYPYIISVVYAGYQGSKYFIWTWFASYLVADYGFKLTSAGLMWAIAATLPAMLCQPLAGFISDKMGRVQALSASLLVTTGLAAALIVLSMLGAHRMPVSILLGVIVLYSMFVNMWVLVWPFTTIMFPTSAGGPIGGVMNTFASLVGACAPVVSGYLIDTTHSYISVFIAGALCAAIGWYASRFLKDYRVV
jgi:MFS transporter, ACS family, D-galactonate transporter